MNTVVRWPPSLLSPAPRPPGAPRARPARPRARSGVASNATAQARPAAGAPAISLHRPWWQRLAWALHERWVAWRAAARVQAELRALAAMDRHVLRDVGLAEFVPPRPAASWQDLERARW